MLPNEVPQKKLKPEWDILDKFHVLGVLLYVKYYKYYVKMYQGRNALTYNKCLVANLAL